MPRQLDALTDNIEMEVVLSILRLCKTIIIDISNCLLSISYLAYCQLASQAVSLIPIAGAVVVYETSVTIVHLHAYG